METLLDLLSKNFVVSFILGTVSILVALMWTLRSRNGADLLDWSIRLLLLLMGVFLLWRGFLGAS